MDGEQAYRFIEQHEIRLRTQWGYTPSAEDLAQLKDAFFTVAKDPRYSGESLLYHELLEDKPYKNEIIDTSFQTAAKNKSANYALSYSHLIKGKPYQEQVLETAFRTLCQSSPSAERVLYHLELLEAKPYKDEIIAQACKTLSLDSYGAVQLLGYSEIFLIQPDAAQTLETAFRSIVNDPKTADRALYFAEFIEDKHYEADITATAIETLAHSQENAYKLIAYAHLLEENPDKDAILKTAFESSVQDGVGARHALYYSKLLKEGEDKENILKTAFKTLAEDNTQAQHALYNAKTLKDKPYKDAIIKTAFESLVSDSKTAAEALRYSDLLRGKPYEHDILDKVAKTANTTTGALSISQYFNSLHDEPAPRRFALLKHWGPSATFDIITQGREEVFTSTYNGILNDMLADLKQENKMLTDVLSPAQIEKMPIFLEAAASYNRMDDVLNIIPPDQIEQVIRTLANDAATADEINYSATMITIMLALKKQPALSHMLETQVKDHYDNARTPVEKDRFGLIASAYGQNAKSISPDMKAFFEEQSRSERYKLPPMQRAEKNLLTDNSGTCNQIMIFANDADSKASFRHFHKQYQGKPGWKIEDKGTYIRINGASTLGTPVRIYANKPEHSEQGLNDIQSEKKSFQMFIGRGHSYHADDYLEFLDHDMKIVHLGSCGGFQNLSTVLQKSPGAHVISTTQIGSMYVNDPLLFSINESIRNKGTIDWTEQQSKLDRLSSVHKESYLLPHKNIPAQMHERYNQLEAIRKTDLKQDLNTNAPQTAPAAPFAISPQH